MKEKQIRNLIVKLQKKARSAPRICLHKDCLENAIDSHLLQKRGILSTIAENSHVVEISLNAYNKDLFEFTRIGIGEAMSYPGFCNKHDTELFKRIETGILDLNDYRTQMLLSYRALTIERRKKEINIDWENRVLASNTLAPYLSKEFRTQLENSIIGHEMGIKDEKFFEDIFLKNIESETSRDFDFIVFELPRIEICCSSVFTYETTQELAIQNIIAKDKINNPLTEIYFHFLPFPDKSIAIIGSLKTSKKAAWEYINSFIQASQDCSLKMISDLLIAQVENWVCSPIFYRKYCQSRELEINKLVRISMKHVDERRSLEFNLFVV